MILICPDFPKLIVKKFSIIISNFSNTNFTPDSLNENVFLKAKGNLGELFLMFSVYFIYNEFFSDVDKVYGNGSTANVKDIKNCKGIDKTFLYEILILSVPDFMEEYNLNTVNLKEDAEEIIDKGLDIKVKLCTLYENSFRNLNLIQSIFQVDQMVNVYSQLIAYLNSQE